MVVVRLVRAVGDYGSSAGDFSFKVLDDEAVEEAEYVVLFVEIVVHYTSWLAVPRCSRERIRGP